MISVKARLYRKSPGGSHPAEVTRRKSPGTGAMLCFMGHTLMENRNGLIVEVELTRADGYAERQAALAMVQRQSPGSTRRRTLGADKGYDSADFVADLRRARVTLTMAACNLARLTKLLAA